MLRRARRQSKGFGAISLFSLVFIVSGEDGQSLQTIARTFTEAYLSGNHEEMKKLLIDPEY